MDPIVIGRLLDDRYRILERRAAGATATVWVAEDEFLRRPVAVKTLHDHLVGDEDLLERFLAEARTAATVGHPALVAVYDTITDHPGIVMEWIDGPDLRQRLDRGPIRPDEAVVVGTTLCDGLSELHRHRLVHRDVKPANILLTTDGRPKLTDFGIATANAGDRTATGVVLGTAKYLAPEQVRGEPIDARTDVFALATVLYEALTGTAPWVRDNDLATALARLDEDPLDLRVLGSGIDADLTGAIMRGLARDPADRWPTADGFAAALRGEAVPEPAAPLPDPIVTGDTVVVAAPAPVTRSTTLPPVPGADATLPTAAATIRAPLPRPPAPTTPAAPRRAPRRPRRRRWPRLVGILVLLAVFALGWVLITDTGPGDGGAAPDGGSGDPADVVPLRAIAAFDPEGTGPPGEHDDRAELAIDGDPATGWPTERYDDRNLGGKSGVGLVLELDGEHDLSTITITTDAGDDWAAEVRVADTPAASTADDFGPVVGRATGLAATASIPIPARGSAVLVWITDLGAGPPPLRLVVNEVTVR